MFHYFEGEIQYIEDKKILSNKFLGIEIFYTGEKTKGNFFLFPYLDQNNHSISYYAFETILQKKFFEQVLKLPGIGFKTAFTISNLDKNQVEEAVENFDLKFFQAIPGIGQKIAKRLLLELKNSFTKEDLHKINIDEKIVKDISLALKTWGYDSKSIKKSLINCPIELKKDNYPEIIKWVLHNVHN